MRWFPLDYLLGPTINILSSPNTASHGLPVLSLSLRTSSTSSTYFSRLFQQFTTSTTSDLILKLVVTCSLTAVFPFSLGVFPPYLERASTVTPYLGWPLKISKACIKSPPSVHLYWEYKSSTIRLCSYLMKLMCPCQREKARRTCFSNFLSLTNHDPHSTPSAVGQMP